MANEVVRFTTGPEANLATTNKVAGTVRFAVDSNNKGAIYFDKDNNTRIKMSGGLDSLTINGNVIGSVDLTNTRAGTITVKRTTFVTGTGTTNGEWAGELAPGTGITELYDGFAIDYWINKAGVSNGTTLNLTLSNGANTGKLPVYYQGTSRLTTQYEVNNVIRLTYRKFTIGSTDYEGWWCYGNYYVNDYYRLRYQNVIKAEKAITAESIIVGTSAGYKPLKDGTVFDINYPILCAGKNIAVSATSDNTYLFYPFTISTTQSITLTAYKPVYIKGHLNGTQFTPINTTPLTQTEPTSEDGYDYINLGMAYNTTAMYLLPEHKIFRYINNKFQELTQCAIAAVTDSHGQNIRSTYIKSVSLSGNTITITKGDDGTSSFNIAITDENVISEQANTTKAYVTGTTQTNGTTPAHLKYDSNIYLDTTAGQLVATKFKGALIGNADTATKATQDSKGQNIASTYISGLTFSGNDTKDADGTTPITAGSKAFANITKGDGGTSKTPLPIHGSGVAGIITAGTQTIYGTKTFNDVVKLKASQYTDNAATASLDLQNSDIKGVNSIKFADLSDSAAEGLQWYRDSTHVDSLWVKNGEIYFTPNREWGTNGTSYAVITSGNYRNYFVLPYLNSTTDRMTFDSIIYAPSTGGTAGQYLRSAGDTKPAWQTAVDKTANGALASTDVSLVTGRGVYYSLAKINNADQTHATEIYAPITGGTANYWLVASGATSAPSWEDPSALTVGKAISDSAGLNISNNYLIDVTTDTENHKLTIKTGAGGKTDRLLNFVRLTGDTMTGALTPVGKEHFIAYPSDGEYSYSGSISGYIKIKIPKTKSATMFTFDVDIYNYVTDTSVRYHIGGYNYSDASWNNTTAYCIAPLANAKADLPIRFLSDGGDNMYVTIGEVDTAWSYPKVFVHNITIGHSGNTYANWSTGWTITLENTAISASLIKRTIEHPNINDRTLQDSSGQQINSTYIKDITVSEANHKLTFTKGNGGTTDRTLDFVKRTGDTMSGTLTVSSKVEATGNNKKISLYASTNRGVYDDSNSEWLIYRATDGNTAYIVNKGKTWTFDSSGNLTTPAGATATANLIGTATRAVNDSAGQLLTGYIRSGSISGKTLTLTTGAGGTTNLTIGLSEMTELLKPISTTTTASASTWNIPTGSYQVWGERFSDNRLKYTPSGGSESTVTDTGDWTMWLSGNGTSNTATLNMRIDGDWYATTFRGALVGNVTGNASTAATWQTARTFTVKDYDKGHSGAGVSVNGSTNVDLIMPDVVNVKQLIAVAGLTGDTTTAIKSSGDILFTNSGTTTRQIRFLVGDNDYVRVAAGATASNAGWAEFATADDGAEPLYVRQYTGAFTTIKRTLTLLDASGHTTLPGDLKVTTTNTQNLGASGVRWKALFIGTADSYGGNLRHIYWSNGVPVQSTATEGSTHKPIYINSGTMTAVAHEMLEVWNGGAVDLNTLKDASMVMVQNGTNGPTAYGNVITMPYRKPYGNTTADYLSQIFIPTADTSTYGSTMYYRGSKNADNYVGWQSVVHHDAKTAVGSTSTPVYVDAAGKVAEITSYGGNAATASAFNSNRTITLSGDTTGSASGNGSVGWSITTKTDRLQTEADNRGTATTPNDYKDRLIFRGLKTNSSFDTPGSSTYSYVFGLRGWPDSSGGDAWELAFHNGGISARHGATTTWGAWSRIPLANKAGVGSATVPVYIAADGTVTSTGKSIAAGSANKIAFYDAASSINAASTSYASNTALGVNTTSVASGYNFQVTGDSYFNGKIQVKGNIIPETNKTYTLGASSYQWLMVHAHKYSLVRGWTNFDTDPTTDGAGTWSFKEFQTSNTGGPDTGQWWHVLTGNSPDSNYNTQLAMGMTFTSLAYRNRQSGSWKAWRGIATIAYNTAVGNETQPVYVNAAGEVTKTSHTLNATINSGTTPRMAWYSGNNAISNTTKIEYINDVAVTGHDGKIQTGLRIIGSGVGTNTDLLSGTTGQITYGDAGPQIQFNSNGQLGAIIASEYDNTSGAGFSFNFVSNQSTTAVKSTHGVFTQRLAVGQTSTDGTFPLHVTGRAAFTGMIFVKNTAGNGEGGISLYGTTVNNNHPEYGMSFTKTSVLGTFGDVSSDWATYLHMNGEETRGWIFQRGTNVNVASISARGRFTGTLAPSSWIDGQRYMTAAYNIADYSNTGSYNPWMRATNTWASGAEDAKVGKYFSFGTLGTKFYWGGSASGKTGNSFDHEFDYDVHTGILNSWKMQSTYSGIGGAPDTNYLLKVYGKSWIQGPLLVGTSDTAAGTGYGVANTGANNYIAFYGVNGDNPGGFNHTYIGERIYQDKSLTAGELSELLIYHGNDVGATNDAVNYNGTAVTGPDRIRMLAHQFQVDVTTAALSGTWDTIGTSTNRESGFIVNRTSGIILGNSTARAGGLNQITVRGHMVIDGSYNTSNSYSEGLRINKSSNGWSVLTLGGEAGSTTGTGQGIWLVGSTGRNFYIRENGSNNDAIMGLHGDGSSEGFSIWKRLYVNTALDTSYNFKVTGNSNIYNGHLYIDRHTTTANVKTDNGASAIFFRVKATDATDAPQVTGKIAVYQTPTPNTYNASMVISPTGSLYLGGGESANSLHSTIAAGSGNENVYLTADGSIYLYSNVDSVANRIGALLTTGGNFIPQKAEANNSGVQSLGINESRWNGYFNTIDMCSLGTPASYPSATSGKITWNGGTDGGDIYYQVDSADAGRLVFNMRDDTNALTAFAYNGTKTIYVNPSTPSIYPAQARQGTIGTISDPWSTFYADQGLYIKMSSDTSNWKMGLRFDNPTATTETYQAGIGWHNTGETISIIPYATSGSPWDRTEGLSVGRTTLLYNNRRVVTGTSAGNATHPVYIDADAYPQPTTYNLQADVRYTTHAATTGGWSTALGRQNNPTLSIVRHNSPVPTWVTEAYSSTLVFGGSDTKGLLNLAYNTPLVTLGGASTGNSTDDAPKWWFKITGTSGTTYNLNKVAASETADTFASAAAVTLTGDTTGTASSTKGWTIATTTKEMSTIGTVANISGGNHASALKAYFDTNKESIPRNKLINFYSSQYSNGSQYFGYFLSGYNDTPYGGFFVSHYNTPYYIGIQNGTFTEQKILTSANFNSVISSSGGASINSGTTNRMAYYSTANAINSASNISVLNNYLISNSRNGATVDIRANGIRIWGQAYGNTANQMLANAAGNFRFGDGGPQIQFNTTDSMNAQAGALIFTDNDSAAAGTSFHFVTTEGSDNNGGNCTVTAPRFRARKGLSVGQNNDNTSYTLYVNGTSYHTNEIICGAANGIRFIGGSGTTKAIIARNDGSNFYLLCADSTAVGNNWYTPTVGGHPFRINLESGIVYCTKVYGAVWNDYAEHRQTVENLKWGQVVAENGDGTQHITTRRLELGCNISSDTFGTSLGEREDAQTPIAVAGRVLAYPNENKEEYKPGDAVCSGPNGTVSKMTRREIRRYPDAIIGYVSEIPDYDIWYAGENRQIQIKVNGRIWIKVN